MFEQTSTPRALQLPQLLDILAQACVDTAASKWHVTSRTLPRLNAIADADAANDPRLRKAITHTGQAVEHMRTMLDELHTARALIHAHLAAQPGNRQTA